MLKWEPALLLQHSFTPFNWDAEDPNPVEGGWGVVGGREKKQGILRCERHTGPAAYLTVELLHGHQVQGLEGVSRRGDEIEADVDPGVVVVEQRALDLQLLLEVVLKLSVDVVHYGLVAVKTGREGSRREYLSLNTLTSVPQSSQQRGRVGSLFHRCSEQLGFISFGIIWRPISDFINRIFATLESLSPGQTSLINHLSIISII